MLLDTSAIIELMRGTDRPRVERIKSLVGDRQIFASPIHLGEIADAARRAGVDVEKAVADVLAVVELVPLDAAIAVQASQIKADARKRREARDFSLIDGVGLASARSRGLPFVTTDPEFVGFPDAIVIPR